MKKRILMRVLAALAGLLLLALACGVTAEAFFGVPVTSFVGAALAAEGLWAKVGVGAAAVALAALGLSCIGLLLPQKRTRRRGFVMQKTENGPIGISVKAIEGLVRSCVQQQETVSEAEITISEGRDGLNIRMDIDQAAGVNIPLCVGAMQKQIKQYVTACTGVDVQEVRVLVENNAPAVTASPFAVQEVAPLPAPAAEPQPEPVAVQEAAEGPAPVAEPAEVPEESPAPAVAPASPVTPAIPAATPPIMPSMPVMPEKADDRPLHQRLFGTEEQPAIVPAPPELVIERDGAEAPSEEAAAEEIPAEETAAEDVPAEELPAEETAAEEAPAGEETPAEAPAEETETPGGEFAAEVEEILGILEEMDEENQEKSQE